MTVQEAEKLAAETVEIMRSRIVDAVRYCEAYAEQQTCTCVVDGSMYSPSTRALPNASRVWEADNDSGLWDVWQEIVVDALEDITVPDGRTDSEHPDEWFVGWQDGCLFAFAPEYVDPESTDAAPIALNTPPEGF